MTRSTFDTLCVCTVALTLVGCGASPASSPGNVVELTQGSFLLAETDTPPPDTAAWVPVTLPDLWSHSRPAVEGSGWYRFELHSSGDSSRFAVYLPKINMNAAVFVNGHWVGDGGSFEPPVAQNWNRPLLFPFSADLLRADEVNVVHVRLYAYAHDWGALYPFTVGPMDALAAPAARQQAWQVTTSQAASLVMLFLALFLGVVSLGRKELVYRYWAAGCLLYFVYSLSGHLREIGLPYPVGRWLIHTCFDAFIVFLVLGVNRWADLRLPRFERIMLVGAGLSALATLLAPGAWFMPLVNVSHVLAISLAVYVAIVVLRRFRQFREWESGVTVLLAVLTLGIGIHAMFVYFGVLSQDEPRLLRLIAPLLVVGFGGVLVARFIRAVAVAEEANRELTLRVAEKEAAMTKQFERLRSLENEQLIAEERNRLMREMHDGMGGRLVSLLALVESGSLNHDLLSDNIRTALDDLRDVVDSLDPDIDDLAMLLGVVRERLDPRLPAHGLQLRWKVDRDLPEYPLSPDASLDVLRFVQECLTNVIKHAGASSVSLEARLERDKAEPRLLLAIEDDGCGFSEARPSGRGLNNLRQRAERLNAEIRTLSAGPGTRVELWLPLPE